MRRYIYFWYLFSFSVKVPRWTCQPIVLVKITAQNNITSAHSIVQTYKVKWYMVIKLWYFSWIFSIQQSGEVGKSWLQMASCFAGRFPPLPFYASPALVRIFKFCEHITMSGYLYSSLGKFQGQFMSSCIEGLKFQSESRYCWIFSLIRECCYCSILHSLEFARLLDS